MIRVGGGFMDFDEFVEKHQVPFNPVLPLFSPVLTMFERRFNPVGTLFGR